jgi:phosphate transport system regulatory protein PhoU
MKSMLDYELETLNSAILEMGLMIENAISLAVISFSRRDADSASSTIKKEEEIIEKGKEIESYTVKLLLRYQPVASDLLKISAAMRMATDMERIGDQASEIASLVIHLGDERDDNTMSSLLLMADKALLMVKKALDAYVRQDVKLARDVIESDDEVDSLFLKIRADIVALIRTEPKKGEAEIDLMMISKYLEKIADHAVNIANWVIYSITGRKEDT